MSEIKAVQDFIKAMNAAAEAIKPAMVELAKEVREIGYIFDKTMWIAYKEAGAPYGENYEGRDRWVKEIGKVQRLHEEAEQILLQHQMYAEMRRIVKREP